MQHLSVSNKIQKNSSENANNKEKYGKQTSVNGKDNSNIASRSQRFTNNDLNSFKKQQQSSLNTNVQNNKDKQVAKKTSIFFNQKHVDHKIILPNQKLVSRPSLQGPQSHSTAVNNKTKKSAMIIPTADKKNHAKLSNNNGMTKIASTPKAITSSKLKSSTTFVPVHHQDQKLMEHFRQTLTLANHRILEQLEVKPEDTKTQMLLQKWIKEQIDMQVKIQFAKQTQPHVFLKNQNQLQKSFLMMQERHFQQIIGSNIDAPYIYVQNLKNSILEAQKKMRQISFEDDKHIDSIKALNKNIQDANDNEHINRGYVKSSRNKYKITGSSKDLLVKNQTRSIQMNDQLTYNDNNRKFSEITSKAALKSFQKIDQEEEDEIYNVSQVEESHKRQSTALGQFTKDVYIDIQDQTKKKQISKTHQNNTGKTSKLGRSMPTSDPKKNKIMSKRNSDDQYDIESDEDIDNNKMDINDGILGVGSAILNIKALNQQIQSKPVSNQNLNQNKNGYQMQKLRKNQQKLENQMDFNFKDDDEENVQVIDQGSIQSLERLSCGGSMKRYLNFQSNNLNKLPIKQVANQSQTPLQIQNQKNYSNIKQSREGIPFDMVTNQSGTPSYVSKSNSKPFSKPYKQEIEFKNQKPRFKRENQLSERRTLQSQRQNKDIPRLDTHNSRTNNRNVKIDNIKQNSIFSENNNQNSQALMHFSDFFQKRRVNDKYQQQKPKEDSLEFGNENEKGSDDEFDVPDEDMQIKHIEKSAERFSVTSVERKKFLNQVQFYSNKKNLPFNSHTNEQSNTSEKEKSNTNKVPQSPSVQSVISMNMKSIKSMSKQKNFALTKSVLQDNPRKFSANMNANSFNLQRSNPQLSESSTGQPKRKFFVSINNDKIQSPRFVKTSEMTKIKHIIAQQEAYPTIKEQIKKRRIAQLEKINDHMVQYKVQGNRPTKGHRENAIQQQIDPNDGSNDSLMSFSNFSDTNENIERIQIETPDMSQKGNLQKDAIHLSGQRNNQRNLQSILNNHESIASNNTIQLRQTGFSQNKQQPNARPIVIAQNLKRKSNTQSNIQCLQTPKSAINIQNNCIADGNHEFKPLSSPSQSNSINYQGRDQSAYCKQQSLDQNKKSIQTEHFTSRLVKNYGNESKFGVKTLPQSFSQPNNMRRVGLSLEIKSCTCVQKIHKMYNNYQNHERVGSPKGNFRNKFKDQPLSEINDTPFILNSPVERKTIIDRPQTMMKSLDSMIRVSEPLNFKQENAIMIQDSGPSVMEEVQPCGNYCKNLPSDIQREIILTAFKNNIDQKSRDKEKLIRKCLQLSNQSSSNSQYHKNQENNLKQLKSNRIQLKMLENDSRYLIASQWWQEWCDYANFDMNQLFEDEDNKILHQELDGSQEENQQQLENQPRGRRREVNQNIKEDRTSSQLEGDFKRELLMIKRKKSLERMKLKFQSFQSSELIRQESEERVTFKFPIKDSLDGSQKVEEYKKPGKIKNQPLLEDPNMYTANSHMKNQYIPIKQNLIEHFDYVLVPADIWAYFKAWYDYDFSLLRYIKRDKMNQDKLYLELYPECKMSEGIDGQSLERAFSKNFSIKEAGNDIEQLSSGREPYSHTREDFINLNQKTEVSNSHQQNKVKSSMQGNMKIQPHSQHRHKKSEIEQRFRITSKLQII